MITLLAIVLFLIVLSIPFKLFSGSTYRNQATDGLRPSGIVKAAGVVLASIFLGIIQPINMEPIDAGNIGLQINNVGDKRGVSRTEYVTGWVFYNDWTSRIKEFPTSQQHIDFEETDIITRGGFQVKIKPAFNYSLNPGNVASMYVNLKKESLGEIEQGWLKNAIIGSVNDVANLFTVDSIFNHRAEFEAAIRIECNKRVSEWFNVSQLRTNIAPPGPIAEAIINKTVAIQNAQAAENERVVAEAKARTQIAVAKGDSAQKVIEAAGKAEAIRKEQMYLTPMYIEYIKSQRWDGKYPTTMLGSGTNMIMSLPNK